MASYEEQMKTIKKIEVEPGIEIGYEDLGSGDNYIICMQMGFADTFYGRRFVDYGYHVILMWNRGSGPSTVPSDDYGENWYNTFAKDVITFADKMGIDKFIYTGASHGSGTGWHLVWNYPERVKAFIALVCGPHPVGGDARGFKNTPHEPGLDFLSDASNDPALKKRRAKMEEYRAVSAQHSLKADYRRPFCQLGSEEKLQEVLKTIQTPTLLIGGLSDLIIPPDLIFRTAKCLPNCKLIMYAKLGHVAASNENTEETIYECLHFLDCVDTNDGRVYAKVIED